MQKKILFILGNYYPEPTGIGRYNSEMVDWLADNGFNCSVISTYPYYPHWKVQPPYENKKRWFTKEKKETINNNIITVYRCPHYVPSNPTGKKRIIFDFSFFISASLKLLQLTGKRYDYIVNVTPPISLGIIAAFYRKFSSALFLYHIQDLQVDVAQDLNMISSKKLINVLFKIESYVLSKADFISTISEGMSKKISTKTHKPVFLFPNWSDTKIFIPLQNKDSLKMLFGFKPDIPVILYSGAIGEKQGLESMLYAAEMFQNESLSAQFVICSLGPYKAILEQKAAELKLNNIIFVPLQPNEQLNAFLNMADIHLVIQKAGCEDLLMPSKLTNILSVGGVAIVTANIGSDLYNIVSFNNIGILCPAENVNALKVSIEQALKADNNNLRVNGRRYAEEYLSIDKIMQRYLKEVVDLDKRL